LGIGILTCDAALGSSKAIELPSPFGISDQGFGLDRDCVGIDGMEYEERIGGEVGRSTVARGGGAGAEERVLPMFFLNENGHETVTISMI